MSESERILCELLVLRCRRGDAAAWRELIRCWERRLFYYVRRIVGGERDAWDVLQQTWLAAYPALPALGEPRAVGVALPHRSPRAVSHLDAQKSDIHPFGAPARRLATAPASRVA